MNLKRKVMPLAAILILGVGSLGVANAAIPEDLRPGMAAMEVRKSDMSKETKTANAVIPSAKVSVKAAADETVAANTDNSPDNSDNASSFNHGYTDEMAEHMNEMDSSPEMNRHMEKMAVQMNEAEHMGPMKDHMGENARGEAGGHMDSEAAERHMNNARHMGN